MNKCIIKIFKNKQNGVAILISTDKLRTEMIKHKKNDISS